MSAKWPTRFQGRSALFASAALAISSVSALAQTPAPNEGLPLPKPPPPTVVHNDDGSTTSFSQSGHGTVATTLDQNGSPISTVYKTPLYNGGRTTTVEAGTATTKAEYDAQGNVVRLERVDTGTGIRNVFEYDDKGQLLKASTFRPNADGKEEPQEIYEPRGTPSGKPERFNPDTGRFEQVPKQDLADLDARLTKDADEIKALQDKYVRSEEDEMGAIRAEAAKEPMAGSNENPSITPTPSEAFDSCLVGTWECVSYLDNGGKITGGGTGFRVTFTSDGTETVDYGSIRPIMVGKDKVSYMGKASAKISTTDGVAKIESMTAAGASLDTMILGRVWQPRIPGLGAGGLGSTTGNNRYQCNGDTLEYQISAARDGHATGTVKLQRIDEIDLLAEGTGSAASKPKRTPPPVVTPKPVSPKPVSPPQVSPRPVTSPPITPEAESSTASPKPKPPPAAGGGKPQPSATLRAGLPSIAPTILPSLRPSAPTSPTPSQTPVHKGPPLPSATVRPSALTTVSATPTTQPTVSASSPPARTPSPTPTRFQSPSITPSIQPSPSSSASRTPGASPSPAKSAGARALRTPSPSPSATSTPSVTASQSPGGGSASSGESGTIPSATASSAQTVPEKALTPIAMAGTEYGDLTIAHDPALPLLVYAGPIAYSASYRPLLVSAQSVGPSASAGATTTSSSGSRQSFPIKFTSEKNGEFSVRLLFEARNESGNVEDIAVRPLRSAQELESALALEHRPPGLFRFGIEPAEFAKLKPGKYSIRAVFVSDKSGEAISVPGSQIKPITIELKPTGLTSDERKIDVQQAARFYLRDRDYAKAEKLSDEARALDGLSVGAWEVRGETFLAQNKLPQAEEAFKFALANSKIVKHPGVSAPREEEPEQISKYLEKVRALKKQKK